MYICRETMSRKCTIGGADVEFGAYDNHVHNEEIRAYHHLCSLKKRNTLSLLLQVVKRFSFVFKPFTACFVFFFFLIRNRIIAEFTRKTLNFDDIF